MSLLTKECEVCGTKISKLRNWYRLIFIDLTRCPNCKREYTLSKWFKWIIDVYSLGFIWIILIVIILDKVFNNLGIEVWLISLIIYLLIKFLIALLIPLKLIENKKES